MSERFLWFGNGLIIIKDTLSFDMVQTIALLLQDYLKFASFTSSLLARSSKLSDLVGQLESELGDKDKESAEAKRVGKPHTQIFTSEYIYIYIDAQKTNSTFGLMCNDRPKPLVTHHLLAQVSAGFGGEHRSSEHAVLSLRARQVGCSCASRQWHS